MTLKLTFELDVKNAQDVERVLTEFEKKLNEIGEAGESLSEYVNKGLGTLGEAFEKLTQTGTGASINRLTQDMEGLGKTMEKSFGIAQSVMVDRFKAGLDSLKREITSTTGQLEREIVKFEQLRTTPGKEQEAEAARARIAGLHSTQIAQLGALEQQERRFAGMMSKDDRDTLTRLTDALKDFRMTTDPRGIGQQIGTFAQTVMPGVGPALGLVGGVAAAATAGLVATSAGIDAVHEVSVLAPLRAYAAERHREMKVATEAARGNITHATLQALDVGAMADWEADRLTPTTMAAYRDYAAGIGLRTVGGLGLMGVGGLVGAASVVGGIGLMATGAGFIPGLGLLAAGLGAGAGLTAAGTAIYQTPGEIREDIRASLMQLDEQRRGFYIEKAGEYQTRRAEALGSIQAQFGRRATNEAFETFRRETGVPMGMAADFARPFLRHGMLPTAEDVQTLILPEAFQVSDRYMDVATQVTRRERGAPSPIPSAPVFQALTDMLVRNYAEVGLGGPSPEGRQIFTETVAAFADRHFVTGVNDLAAITGRVAAPMAEMAAIAFGPEGGRIISPTEVAAAGVSLAATRQQMEVSPESGLNIHLQRILMEKGVADPLERHLLINMGLHRPEAQAWALARSRGYKTPEAMREEMGDENYQKALEGFGDLTVEAGRRTRASLQPLVRGSPLAEAALQNVITGDLKTAEMGLSAISRGVEFDFLGGVFGEQTDQERARRSLEQRQQTARQQAISRLFTPRDLPEDLQRIIAQPVNLSGSPTDWLNWQQEAVRTDGDITDSLFVYRGAETDGEGRVRAESEQREIVLATAALEEGLRESFTKVDAALQQIGKGVIDVISEGFAAMAQRIVQEGGQALDTGPRLPGDQSSGTDAQPRRGGRSGRDY